MPEIMKGTWNNLNRNNSQVEYYAAKRLMHCDGCVLRDGTFCSSKLSIKQNGVEIKGCGCIVESKVRSLGSSCPMGKWGAEVVI